MPQNNGVVLVMALLLWFSAVSSAAESHQFLVTRA